MDTYPGSKAARRLAACLSQRTALSALPDVQELIPQFTYPPPALPFPDPDAVTWDQIYKIWNPPKSQFLPSEQWYEALRRLQVPADPAHLGTDPTGLLRPPFNRQNLASFSTPKTGFLCVMVSDLGERGAAVLKDMKGEVNGFLHPKVQERYGLKRGSVLMLNDVTVLPKRGLNVVVSNVSDVIE